MRESTLALLGAGFSILQFIVGGVMVFYGVSVGLLGVHALLALIILVIAVLGIRTSSAMFRRMSIGNVALVVITGVIGVLVYRYEIPWITIIHLILALGLVSNFSVMYGTSRAQR